MFQSVLYFAALLVSLAATSAQAEIPAICEQDNGSLIADCAKTCITACEDARFLTPHRAACNQLFALPKEQLTNRQVCEPKKDLCERYIPEDTSPPGPGMPEPPSCLKSFPYITCLAGVVSAEYEGLLTDYSPIIQANIPRMKDKESVCKYTKKDLEDLNSRSEKLKKRFIEIGKKRYDLEACVNSTNDWVRTLRCPARAPEGMCDSIKQSFTEENKKAMNSVEQSNKKALENSSQIEGVQAGIDFINQFYRFACINTQH